MCLKRILRQGKAMGEPFSCSVFLVSLCLLFISMLPVFAVAEDSLTADQSINDTQTLESSNFVLGFFTPAGSKHRYLGIWYKRIPGQTVVWVANRLRPLPDNTGVLRMLKNGSLVLTDVTSAVYWSPVSSAGVISPIAKLQDDGNFVIFDTGTGNNGGLAWQSFEHPTDTMLPGMRIGVDLATGLSRNITTWRSPDDPAPGAFSFAIDPRGDPQLIVGNGTAMVWRAGPWVGERFTGIPEMKANNVFNYGFNPIGPGVYFQYDVWNKSQLSRIVINQSAVAQHYVWEEDGRYWKLLWHSRTGSCDRAGACGRNSVCDASKSPKCSCVEGFKSRSQQAWEPDVAAAGNCVPERPPHCQKGTDGFVNVANAKLPDTSTATVNMTVGFDDCRAACLRNCSCTAFTSSDGSGCITWFADLVDLMRYTAGAGQDLNVRAPAGTQGTTPHSTPKKGKRVILIIVTTVPVFLLLVWMGVRLCRSWARRRNFQAMRDISENYSNDESSAGNDFELPAFHLSTIIAATENFSVRNKLGEGGFGPVYKGKLQDGLVAVKRLSANSRQGLEEFKCEVRLVAKLQHTNLVRLLGFCIEAEEKILIYEYMPNKSLDKFIFDPARGEHLDWTKRFNIIEGIAQGLLYLHKYSRLRVIHRDLKASNILLDDEWNPKISDFGMARIFTWKDTQANTKRVVGTYGYMPPEYAMKGIFSVKSDVFSFGILVLEILSGKRNTSTHYFGISSNLSGYAWNLWNEGRALEVMDPKLANTCSTIETSRCIHVALLCVQENPVDRPTMLDVVSMLNNESVGLPVPNRPAYYFDRYITTEDTHFEIEGMHSTNDATFSEIQAR